MANTGNVNENDRLVELRGSGYEIVKGEPDIRNWEVRDAQGRAFGKVDELIFDKESQKVRYIVLNLKGNQLNLKARKVLVPIGLAKLDEHRDEVILPEVTAVHLTELFEYKKIPITYDEEDSTRTIFAGLGLSRAGSSGTDNPNLNSPSGKRADFYSHSHFDDEQLHQRSARAASENTSLGDRINERPVDENVRAQSEKLNVDPSDVNRPATATDLKSFEEGTIEFTEKKEVPIVTKEARVVEEIALKKEIEEREAHIKDTVRKTDVKIERDNTDENRT